MVVMLWSCHVMMVVWHGGSGGGCVVLCHCGGGHGASQWSHGRWSWCIVAHYRVVASRCGGSGSVVVVTLWWWLHIWGVVAAVVVVVATRWVVWAAERRTARWVAWVAEISTARQVAWVAAMSTARWAVWVAVTGTAKWHVG